MKNMFKRREVFGAIVAVAVALVLIGCPGTTPGTLQVTANLADIEFPAGDMAARTVDLSKHFSTSRNNLDFDADSSMKAYVTASVSGSTLTVTPVKPGSSTVTVTADDGNEEKSRSFTVTVMAPPPTPKPEITATIPTPITFASVDADPITSPRPFSDFFSGADSYVVTTEPMDQQVVDLAVAEEVLTVTPKGVGHTVVIITAVNAGGSVSQTVVVTVGTPPDPPIMQPMISKIFGAVNFAHDDRTPREFDLSMYFSMATTYEPMTSDAMVVTAAVDDMGMLTVTPEGEGTANVTVTASSDDSRATPVTQTLDVTVVAARQKPDLKANMMFEPMKITDIADVFPATGGTAPAEETENEDAAVTTARETFEAATLRYMLATYITDPDGDDSKLKFSTATDDEEVALVYATPENRFANPTDDQKAAMMATGSDITIRGRKVGTATITVTATDADMETRSWSFMVTVADMNTGPSVDGAVTFPGTGVAETDTYREFVLIGNAGRFKSTDTAAKKLEIDLGAIFVDPNVETDRDGDTWKFKAMSTDPDVVTADLEKVRDPDVYNVVITPVGSGRATIYFTAEDSFGEMAGGKVAEGGTDTDSDGYVDNTSFPVMVNTPPLPYSGDGAARKSLSTEDSYMNLVVGFAETANIVLADDPTNDTAEGYFSDKDALGTATGDVVLCRLLSKTGESVTFDLSDARTGFTLAGVADKAGISTFTVRCFDQVNGEDFEYVDDTLTVNVKFLQSISD